MINEDVLQALAFYANPKHHSNNRYGGYTSVGNDCGDIARKALSAEVTAKRVLDEIVAGMKNSWTEHFQDLTQAENILSNSDSTESDRALAEESLKDHQLRMTALNDVWDTVIVPSALLAGVVLESAENSLGMLWWE